MKPILRSDRDAVTPVVAEILLVAIAVVLAAVVYIMATSLLTNPGTTMPFVTFAPLDRLAGDGNVTIRIAGASQSLSYAVYRFALLVNNVTAGGARYFGASGVAVNVTVGGLTFVITYSDVGGGGILNDGDTIRVTGSGAPLPKNVPLAFYLIWSDGSMIQKAEWTM